MKTKDVGDFLLEKFPLENCQNWDKCGWQFLFDTKFLGATICLDLTNDVLDFALKNSSNLIITHHPFFFYQTKKEEYAYSPYKKKLTFLLKKKLISVISLHTNFDSKENQTAFSIIKQCGFDFDKIEKIDEFNILFQTSADFNEILKKISLNTNLTTFRSNVEKNFFPKKVAILPGSGGILACLQAKKQKADLIITSDLKWSDQITLYHKKIKVLEIPHLIEQVFVFEIERILKEKYSKIPTFTVKLAEILKEMRLSW
ncbi:Nif3-like dinuclear metal center hexameric protein [Mesomycoplasma hyopneumoniae]|uniref:Nif3-like dinuclear metal center hexameric protein n=1 Tax=Mesomycoplasma hyopneumoniae TaxID=2099 RepID=UPI001371BF36|nr:Nif3-like dinuclear metal center hexameric protein [Mesomycoplasma hyopneumoniae]MXR34145.1 Nif3-like dinuclear metal center hexameric protein [Mesomycoplasma hyopneumoniae]